MHECKSHVESFSLFLAIENPRPYLLRQTDILQKTVVGHPECQINQRLINMKLVTLKYLI